MGNETDIKTKDLPVKEVQTAEPSEPAETVDPPAEAYCPNCNGPGIRKGKVIACQVCDASFRYTEEGPKVEELGPFDDHERRIAKLEGETSEGIGKRIAEITESRQPPEPEPPEPAKPQPPEPSEDDGI